MFLIHDFHLSKGPNKPYIKNNNKKKNQMSPFLARFRPDYYQHVESKSPI